MLIAECYRKFLEIKIEQADGKPLHVFLDEYQEFIELLIRQGTYKSYAAIVSDCGSVLSVASQSESSIYSKIGNQKPAESFVGHILL